MRILDLILKDLTQIARDRKSLIFLIVMPLLFTAFMGLAFSRNSAADSRLPVAWNDNDGGLLAQQLLADLEASTAIRIEKLDAGQVGRITERIQDESLAAAVIVPAGFSQAHLASGESEGSLPQLELVCLETSVACQTASQVVQASVVRVLSAAEMGRLSASAIDGEQPFASDAERQAFAEATVLKAGLAWQQPPVNTSIESAKPVEQSNQVMSSNPFNQSSPGMMVMFSIFGLTMSSSVLVAERKSRTLQRMLTTPIRRAEVIAGHALAMFTVVFLQELLLVTFGQLILKVDYLRQPLAVLIVMVGLALWVSSLGLFIGVWAKGEEQVNMFSLMAMFVFSAMGGAWFPIEFAGKTFYAIGHLMPSAWAMDGFQNLLIRGLELNSALLPGLVLLGYTVLFYGLSVWRFKAE